MVLVRIAYAADLPTPDEVIRSLDGNGNGRPHAGNWACGAGDERVRAAFRRPAVESRRAPRARSRRPAIRSRVFPKRSRRENRRLVIGRFEELITLAASKRDLGVKLGSSATCGWCAARTAARGRLEQSAAKTLVNDLARKISQLDQPALDGGGVGGGGEPTVKSQNDARQAELKTGVRAIRWCRPCSRVFPGAESWTCARARRSRRRASAGDGDQGPEPPPDDDGFAYGGDDRPDDDEL